MREPARAAPRRRRPVTDDRCPGCGSPMREARGTLCLPVNGVQVAVPATPHLRCPTCDEVVLRWHEAGRLGAEAVAIYRRQHGLLAADEIRALRLRLGLTQHELAGLLKLGSNTVSRWESGRNAQTSAMDLLLRLLRDLPGCLDYLRARAA